METSTNGQTKHRLERYSADEPPTIKAPPPHSVYPPEEVSLSRMVKVLLQLALVLVAILYAVCVVLMFAFFSDNWYLDEASRAIVVEGMAILVVGAGLGAGGYALWRKSRLS